MRRWALAGVVLLLAAAVLIGLWYRDQLQPSSDQGQVLVASADCDPQRQPCVAGTADAGVQFHLPEGARLMQPFPVEVTVHGPALDGVTVDFRMQGMDMGVNRVGLQAAADGLWRAQVILPLCATGRADWIATVEARSDGSVWRARFPFSAAP